MTLRQTRAPYIRKQIVFRLGFIFLIILALTLRLTLLRFKSVDYLTALAPWFSFLKVHGLHGLKYNFSNYNLPYLYLLYIATLIPLSKIILIKGISIVFDLWLAYGVYLVVRYFNPKTYLPHLAAIATLFLPTVFLNSSMWGQADSIYASFLVFSFYFALRRSYALMWLMWTLSFIFKLQSVFFLPLLVAFGTQNKIWKKVYVVPLVTIISALPALMLGRPISSIIDIYTKQVGFYHALTLNAPNMYQWIPNSLFSYFNKAGVILTIAVVVSVLLITYLRKKLTDREWLLLATLILLLVPFFLPQMHERYFYPAEIFSLILAFVYRPVIWYAPLMQFVTICAYTPFLFNARPVLPLGIIAIFVLTIIVHLSYRLFIKGQAVNSFTAQERDATNASLH